jgi:hypothetical protein
MRGTPSQTTGNCRIAESQIAGRIAGLIPASLQSCNQVARRNHIRRARGAASRPPWRSVAQRFPAAHVTPRQSATAEGFDCDVVAAGNFASAVGRSLTLRFGPLRSSSDAFYSGDDVVGRALTGGFLEAPFDSESVGRRVHQVRAEWDRRPLAAVSIDFDKLK